MDNQQEQEPGKSILSFGVAGCGALEQVHRKAFCLISVKVRHQRTLLEVRPSKWTGFSGTDSPLIGCWHTLHKPPTEKRTADLKWRIFHGVIATNRHVAHLDPTVGRECLLCDQEEDVGHLFSQCSRLQSLFQVLQEWCRRLCGSSVPLFLGGLGCTVPEKRRACLVKFLFGQAKLAIWKTRKSRRLGVGSHDAKAVLLGLVMARLRIEFL